MNRLFFTFLAVNLFTSDFHLSEIESSPSASSISDVELLSDRSSDADHQADVANDHSCHLGCCPALIYDPLGFKVHLSGGSVSHSSLRFFVCNSLAPPLRPPIS